MRAHVNLHRDGYAACAAFVARRIRNSRRTTTVYVAKDGGLHLSSPAYPKTLPRETWVGCYPYTGLREEFIEDDLLERQRELTP